MKNDVHRSELHRRSRIEVRSPRFFGILTARNREKKGGKGEKNGGGKGGKGGKNVGKSGKKWGGKGGKKGGERGKKIFKIYFLAGTCARTPFGAGPWLPCDSAPREKKKFSHFSHIFPTFSHFFPLFPTFSHFFPTFFPTFPPKVENRGKIG